MFHYIKGKLAMKFNGGVVMLVVPLRSANLGHTFGLFNGGLYIQKRNW